MIVGFPLSAAEAAPAGDVGSSPRSRGLSRRAYTPVAMMTDGDIGRAFAGDRAA